MQVTHLKQAIALGDAVLAEAPQKYTPGSGTIISCALDRLLFLAELSRQSEDPQYLASARLALQEMASCASGYPVPGYSLHHGKMGIVYACTMLEKHCPGAGLTGSVLDLALACSDTWLNDPYTPDHLFGGRAGTLLALLHLHAVTGERRLLLPINAFIGKLIGNAEHSSRGVFWRMTNTNVRAECGYGYGASGIGFVFTELGSYTGNPAFYHLAERAFAYERSCRDENIGNWPAYSKEIDTAAAFREHRENYRAGKLELFAAAEDDNSYARGTIGIAFTRMRAWQLLGRAEYAGELSIAMTKIRAGMNGGGMDTGTRLHFGLLLAEAGECMQRSDWTEEARNIAWQTELANDGDTDRTLLGFLHLRLNASGFSIFLPQLPAGEGRNMDAYPYISLPRAEMQRRLERKNFSRTIHLLEKLDRAGVDACFQNTDCSLSTWVEKRIACFDHAFREIFQLEKMKVEMGESVTNGALLFMQEMDGMDKVVTLLQLEQPAYMQTRIALGEGVRMVNTRLHPVWNLDEEPGDGMHDAGVPTLTLLKPVSEKFSVLEMRRTFQPIVPASIKGNVAEFQPDAGACLILSVLDQPRSIGEVMEMRSLSTPAPIEDLLIAGFLRIVDLNI